MPEPLCDEEFAARVVKSDVAFTGSVWDVVRDRFEFGGQEIVREYQRHPGAVAVLAEDSAGQVLLIKQYRHPIRCRDWELPAGLLDVHGEEPLAAAQRELAEEADLIADEWALLSQFFSSPGGSSEMLTVYRARGLSPTASAFEREAEEAEIELRWAPLDEVVSGVLNGRLRNAILANAVLTAALRDSSQPKLL